MRGSSKRKLLWTLTILYWIGIFTCTHIPIDKLPPIPLSDKTEHVIIFTVLSSLLMICLRMSKPRWNVPVAVLAICMVYGAVDEWLQIPVHRSCDIHDWFADTTGAAVGVVLTALARTVFGRRQRRNEL